MTDIPALLKQFGVRPKKSLGQNFLTDETALQRIVMAGAVGPQDTVLEIGPGVGNLTRHLARAARRVVAVELDERLIPLLHTSLADLANVEIIHGDILELSTADLLRRPAPHPEGAPTESPISNPQSPLPDYKAVANIPYYITAPLLRHLLESEPRPSLIVLTVQNEVAERICAKPGQMSLLAVSVQFYGRPEIVARLPTSAFYPPPKVDSAVVRIVPYEHPPVQVSDVAQFFRVVKAGFSQKRKQLKNALAGGLRLNVKEVERALNSAGIDPSRRAETLTIDEWARIAGIL